MNVFVLCTGRCGSVSFARACAHISNFSARHETNVSRIGEARLQYPPQHIEVDNRLSWYLGRLDQSYGTEAFYVHLQRDMEATAASFAQRYQRGIIRAYRQDGIIANLPPDTEPMAVCRDYCQTVNSNISLFLRDKPQQLSVQLERIAEDFPRFWSSIGAEGNLEAAMKEFATAHNATPSRPTRLLSWARRLGSRALPRTEHLHERH